MIPCVLLLLLTLAACHSQPASEPAATELAKALTVDPELRRQIGIEVQPVSSQAEADPVAANGQLQLDEDRTWKVGALIEGRVVNVPMRLGQRVVKGQVIAELHSHSVHDARAARRQAIAELSRLKVLSGQAMRVRDRTRRLFDLTAASREQLEAAETALRSAEFSVTNAEAEVEKANSHLTEFLDVPIEADAAHERGEENDRIPIRAPAAGVVMERLVNVGSVVSAAAPVAVISDLSSLWLIAAVNEADLARIRQGQPVSISVRAYPERKFRGIVVHLGERLDAETRTLQVRIAAANPGGMLKPDMYATVEFAPQPAASGIRVPEAAIQEMGGKHFVFVQKAGEAFERREVTPGRRADRQVQILTGLRTGDRIVVSGAHLLKGQLLQTEGN